MTHSIPVSLCRKALAFLLVVCCAGGAFAANVVTWTDASGDHCWGNPQNWEPNTSLAPYAHNYEVHIPSGTWVIDVGAGGFWYGPIILDEGSGDVTFAGSGEVICSGYGNITMGAGRELIVDGCVFNIATVLTTGSYRVRSGWIKAAQTVSLGGSCCIHVDGGVFGGSTTDLSIGNSASLIITGGLAHLRSYKVYGSDEPGERGGLIRLTGGTLQNDDSFANYRTQIDGGRFENLGGTVLWGDSSDGNSNGGNNRLSSEAGLYGEGEAFALYLPPVGGVLDIPSTTARDDLGALRFAVPGDYSFGGTVFVTNATADVRSACVYFGDGNNQNDETVSISGGATIYANRIGTAHRRKQNLDLSRINLGTGGISLLNEVKMRFLNGIVFGAWGDWSVTIGLSSALSVAGVVTFDTLDCFDGTATHSICMTADIAEATELKAVGGGTVTLATQTVKDELRLIEVGADTTFNVTGKMKTMNLKLCDGATLGLDLSAGGYLDAAGVASLGDGAKIVVTAVPATLTAKTLYPVYSAPAGTNPDLAKVEVAATLPDGWGLGKTGNSIFLTDGQTDPDARTRGSQYWAYWSGGGSDGSFGNADNWIDGAKPSSAWQVYFYGCHNREIEVGSNNRFRFIDFSSSSGPFVFSGSGAFTFEYPDNAYGFNNQASLRSTGRFSVVVGNPIGSSSAERSVWIQSFGEGSIAAIAGLNTVNPFCFGGDVRIGGIWQVPDLRAQQCYGGATVATRRSRLTVMPNAALTVQNQTADQPFNTVGVAGLSVAVNGAATVSGTEFLMESNNVHYIDGTLTVNCPLVASAKQTFLGEGTLKIAEAAGDLALEGAMTLVPGADMGTVAVAFKGEPTVAPEGDWTYVGETTFALEGHSMLTLVPGGHTLTLAKPFVSEGTLALKGDGKVIIGTTGLSVGKVVCRNGAKIALGGALKDAQDYTDVLTVRDPEPAPVFDETVRTKVRYDATRNRYVYSAKQRRGLILLFR